MRKSNSNKTFKIILLNFSSKIFLTKYFYLLWLEYRKGEFPLFLLGDLCQLSYLLIHRCLYQSSHWPLAETQHSALKVFDLMTDSVLFLWITSHDCNRPADRSTERGELMHIRFLTLLPVWMWAVLSGPSLCEIQFHYIFKSFRKSSWTPFSSSCLK